MFPQFLRARVQAITLFALFVCVLPLCAQQWYPIGLQDKDVKGLYVSPYSGAMFAGTTDGVYRSTNSGSSWENVLTVQLQFASWQFAATSQDTIFAIASHDKFARSFDGGLTWEKFDSELVLQELGVIKGLFADTRGYVYIGTTAAVMRSRDGDNWQTISTGLPANFPDVHTFAEVLPNDIIAGTQGIVGGHIYRLSGTGTTWTKIYTGVLNEDVITLGSTFSSTLLASVHNKGLLRSTDGTLWNIIPLNGISSPVTTILASNVAVYALAGTNILRSQDDGATWQTLTTAPNNVNAVTLGMNGSVLIATASGLYRLAVSTDVEETQTPDIQFTVFPHPVRDNANCSFTLPVASAIHCTLANAAGEVVRDFPVAHYPAGVQTFSWNTAGLAAGVYYLHLEAEGYSSAHRVVILP
jgi:hypothetical protein